MLPFDKSEIGQRRARRAIERVAEVGRRIGSAAAHRLRQGEQPEVPPEQPENDPDQEPS